jgi:drug/metabolite transporter (DMT)-like permease
LTTAVFWSVGSLLFAETARRAGVFALNQFRITLALVFLTVILVATRTLAPPATGPAWPPLPQAGVLLLAVSGFIGLTIGDMGYFGCLMRLGPRIATALAALAPPITALIAWVVLGETLSSIALFGMGLVLAGVLIVIMERGGTPVPRGHRIQGALLGLLGAACQAVGLILSKKGMKFGIDPLPANVIRMAAATVGIWGIAAATRQLGAPTRVLNDRVARLCALGATLLGPTFGVWLSLVAAQRTEAGIAATLMSTVPVLILPLVIFVNHEKVSPRAVLGAVLTVVGVALIFVR